MDLVTNLALVLLAAVMAMAIGELVLAWRGASRSDPLPGLPPDPQRWPEGKGTASVNQGARR